LLNVVQKDAIYNPDRLLGGDGSDTFIQTLSALTRHEGGVSRVAILIAMEAISQMNVREEDRFLD